MSSSTNPDNEYLDGEDSGEGAEPVTGRLDLTKLAEQSRPQGIWSTIGDWSKRYVLGIVLSKRGNRWSVSLGRVAFVAVLIEWFVVWASGRKEMPPGLLEVFGILAAYTFGSKVTGILGDKFRRPGGPTMPDSPQDPR